MCSTQETEQEMKEQFKKLWQLLQERNEISETEPIGTRAVNRRDGTLSFYEASKKADLLYNAPAQLNSLFTVCLSGKKIDAFLAAANMHVNAPIVIKEREDASKLEINKTTLLTIISHNVIYEQCAYRNLSVNTPIIKELLKRGATPNTHFVQQLKQQFEQKIKELEQGMTLWQRWVSGHPDYYKACDIREQKRMRDAANQILGLYNQQTKKS